jgi:hypothetical protein
MLARTRAERVANEDIASKHKYSRKVTQIHHLTLRVPGRSPNEACRRRSYSQADLMKTDVRRRRIETQLKLFAGCAWLESTLRAKRTPSMHVDQFFRHLGAPRRYERVLQLADSRRLQIAQLPVAVAVEELELLPVQLGEGSALRYGDDGDAELAGLRKQLLLHVHARRVRALVEHC